MCTKMAVFMYTCMHIYIYIYIYIYTRAHVHIHIHTVTVTPAAHRHILSLSLSLSLFFSLTLTHTQIYTHTHTHTYTSALIDVPKPCSVRVWCDLHSSKKASCVTLFSAKKAAQWCCVCAYVNNVVYMHTGRTWQEVCVRVFVCVTA